MALMTGRLFAGALFVGGLLGSGQVAPPIVPQQTQRAGGGGRRRGKVRRIYPGDPIQLEMFPPEIPQTNVIQFAPVIRSRAIRRREEEFLLAA